MSAATKSRIQETVDRLDYRPNASARRMRQQNTHVVELSFLKKDEQENLFATMESEEATPSLSQAQRMKSLSQSGRLDMDTIFAIMTEEKGNQKETLKINTSKLKKYFPKNTTPKQMEETIIKLLERELQRKRGRDSR